MAISLQENSTILFQGDSITDCRRREQGAGRLGCGYVFMAASRLMAAFPELSLNCINRGISGNRMSDLAARWQEDALDIAPDIVSILIGINDTWRRYDSNDPSPVDTYREAYHAILEQIVQHCNPQIVLCEPFVLPYPQDRITWREDLDPRIQVVRSLAREFNATLVPFDAILAAASVNVPPSYWAEDGVHPTAAGHALLANTWLEFALGRD